MDILTDNKKHRKTLLGLTVVGLLLFSLYFVIGRIQVSLISNVLFQNSFWVRFLPSLQTLITVCSFALFYGISVFSLWHYGIKKTVPVVIIVFFLTLLKYAASLLGTLLIDRADTETFIMVNLPLSLLSFCLELLQYAIILTIAWFTLRSFRDVNAPTVPQPLSHSLLFISLTVTLINVASRMVYDIDYGAPASLAETLRMVLAYASDVLLYGVLLYVLMRFVIKLIHSYHQKNL